MKVIKYILISSFLLIMIGIIARTIIPFWGGNMSFILGVLIVVLLSPVYGILAFVKKQHRIEASMLLVSILLILGVLFNLMRWPGGNAMIIAGSQTLCLASICVFLYSIVKKIKIPESILFALIGYSALAYCFKVLLWPGAKALITVAFITLVIALFFVIKKTKKITVSKIVLGVVILLLNLSFITKESTFYKRGNRQLSSSEPAYHQVYHEYAWILYNEGDIEKAKSTLQQAINEMNTPKNEYNKELPEDRRDAYLKLYQNTMNLLNSSEWDRMQWIEIPYKQ